MDTRSSNLNMILDRYSCSPLVVSVFTALAFVCLSISVCVLFKMSPSAHSEYDIQTRIWWYSRVFDDRLDKGITP